MKIEIVNSEFPLVITGILMNEEGIIAIYIYRESKRSLTPIHSIDNYSLNGFKIYKAVGNSYTILMHEGEDFYQYNMDELLSNRNINQSIISEVNSIEMDGKITYVIF